MKRLLLLIAVALLFTPNQGQAQTLSISQADRSVRDSNGNGVIYPRARDAMRLDPTGVWSSPDPNQRMNVGVFVELDLVATPGGASITDIQWTIQGQVFKDTTITSDKSTGAGYRTQCDTVPLTSSDLQPQDCIEGACAPIQFVWVNTGTFTVQLDATVNGTELTATRSFEVQRNPKAEIFFVTGPGNFQSTNPGENPDNLMSEHVYWHIALDPAFGNDLTPEGEFFRFHRGFIQKFNCWRAIFGYPAVRVYVTAPDYVPANTPDYVVDHVGVPKGGTGVVFGQRAISGHSNIEFLPLRFTLAGIPPGTTATACSCDNDCPHSACVGDPSLGNCDDAPNGTCDDTRPGSSGEVKLADFADEDQLAAQINLFYHGRQHTRICQFGDFTPPTRTPADPIFWRFHWMLTKVNEVHQFLDLGKPGGGLTVPADSAFGAQVFFPEPAMKIFPTAAEGSTQDCFPPSGSFFPIGETFVTCTVKDVTLLDPNSPDLGGTTTQVTFRVKIDPPPLPTVGPVDIFFIVDLSGSFIGDLATFKSEVAGPGGVIDTLKSANPDTRFGLAKFEDYPIDPFGIPGDKAYERIVDLTFDDALVKATINALPVPAPNAGNDLPQSQLTALFQAATGAGQDLSGEGFPKASIPVGQQASFRTEPGTAKIIFLWTDAAFHNPGDPGKPGGLDYPGPSFQDTVDAIAALDPPKIIGIAKDPDAIPDLEDLAIATDSLAPAGGVDCDDDGFVDILEGEPLVCSTTAPDSVGIGLLIVVAVEAALESPIAEAGPFQVVECDSPAGASVTLMGDASRDPITGDPLTFSWTGPFGAAAGPRPTVTLPLGHNSISLTCTDPDGNTGTDRVLIIARDTTPPEITCTDVTVECNAQGGVSGSDPAILAFLTGASAGDVCDSDVLVGDDAPGFFPLGSTAVTFTATDDAGNVGQCVATVDVVDTTAPIVSMTLDPDHIWPPNHKLRDITATVDVQDVCDPTPGFVLASISSNEPDNGRGDGNTTNDIQNAALGTPDVAFRLRSERSGRGSGRIYTVTYTGSDGSGNTTDTTSTVRVAHDKR